MGLARWEGSRLLQPHVHLECLFVEGRHQRAQQRQQPDHCAPAGFEALIRHRGQRSRDRDACVSLPVHWRLNKGVTLYSFSIYVVFESSDEECHNTDLPAFLKQIIFKDEFNNRETLTSLFVEVSLNREPEVWLQATRCVQTENRFYCAKSLYHLCLFPTNSESNISNISVLLLRFTSIYIFSVPLELCLYTWES